MNYNVIILYIVEPDINADLDSSCFIFIKFNLLNFDDSVLEKSYQDKEIEFLMITALEYNFSAESSTQIRESLSNNTKNKQSDKQRTLAVQIM